MTLDHAPTLNGYYTHLSRGEVPCKACIELLARSRHHREFRAGRRHDPHRCKQCGSVFPFDHSCHLEA